MNTLEDILEEYIRLRQHGLEMQETLLTLKNYVEPLDASNREALTQLLRGWEKGKLNLETIIDGDTKPPKTDQINWLRCPYCDKTNRAKEVFCYNCGEILQKITETSETNFHDQATETTFPNKYFGQDSIMILDAQNAEEYFELKPQLQGYEITLGRGTQSRNNSPNISFTSFKASELGVSRLHVAIRFNKHQHILQVEDLDSANGTFINNQRLYPNEQRILCNRDKLRLGRMILKVKYLHKAELA